ncbi:transposase [Paenibacillus sp. EPM92]|uniref:transposase n=1 Tax=Paenibacillus sp. EPM92 TaxID=1561195 RepID=UPI0037C7D15C
MRFWNLKSATGTILSLSYVHSKDCFPPKRAIWPLTQSYQGNQYTFIAYGRLLEQHGITQSMSRKGTPLDNAPVESFFGWFKNELYVDYRPRSPEELREAVYVHALFHNNERPQSRLKNNAPIPTGMSALSGFNISVYKDLTSSALAAFLHPF